MKIKITYTPIESRRVRLIVDTIMQLLGKCRVHKGQNEKISIIWLTF